MNNASVFDVIRALVLGAVGILSVTGLAFVTARVVIWWRNRRPPTVYIEQMPRYEWSDRERR